MQIFARATLFEDAEKNLEKIAELNERCKKLLDRKDAVSDKINTTTLSDCMYVHTYVCVYIHIIMYPDW